MNTSEKVVAYFEEEHLFKKSIALLRKLALQSNLEETFKWAFPTYMLYGKNVLAICRFKNHCGIWFFNGVFLSDVEDVLENAQEGKTQAMRHWKFLKDSSIDVKKVTAYINEAIENERKGVKLPPKKKSLSKAIVPPELEAVFKKEDSIKKAFAALSAYKRKEYCEYITIAKQEKTKLSRLEKILPMITEGVGLNDMYR